MPFEFVFGEVGTERVCIRNLFPGNFNLSVLEALLHSEEFLEKGLGYAGLYVMQLGWLGGRLVPTALALPVVSRCLRDAVG